MKEKQFLQLPAQGNIYSTARLGSLILIGSGNFGKIMVYSDTMITSLDELTLSTVPQGVDILALETVHGEIPGTGPMLGLTYIQKTLSGIEEVKIAYLNIYADFLSRSSQSSSVSVTSPSNSFGSTPRSSISSGSNWKPRKREDGFNLNNLEVLCQRCVSFKLAFTPYHLYHVGNVFLLSSSDNRIYAYEPTEDMTSFANIPVQKYFPELEGQFPSVVTRIQIETIHPIRQRVTLIGCEDGSLRAFVVSNSTSPSTSVVMPSVSSPRSSLTPRPKLPSSTGDAANESSAADDVFTEDPEGVTEAGDALVSSMNDDLELDESFRRYSHQFDGMITSIQIYTDGVSINAVVSSANSPVYVYTDTLDHYFEKGHALRFSSKWDCVEAICVADLDFDGDAEIVIGTFGCTLLVYKFMEEMQRWVIVSNRKFPSAIFHIEFANYQLHVVTGIGLHIIEYNTDAYFLKRGMIPSRNMENALARLDLDERED